MYSAYHLHTKHIRVERIRCISNPAYIYVDVNHAIICDSCHNGSKRLVTSCEKFP